MMDWTDRHCRYLHRLLSKHTLLYTEMVTAAAVVHGDKDRLLGFDPAEHPVALQLGGSDPALLAQATAIGSAFGYDEINLNVGCPSDRVQSGRFGACLMREPDLVADCVEAMQGSAGAAEVTVKCRIGVDDQVPEDVLPEFLEKVSARGVRSFTIHARMAWLEGAKPQGKQGYSTAELRSRAPDEAGLSHAGNLHQRRPCKALIKRWSILIAGWTVP